MTDKAGIEQRVEQLAEAIVLTEPTDLSALAGFHTTLQELQQWATEQNAERVTRAVEAAAELVERIILQDVEDAAGAMDIVGRTVGATQGFVSGDRPAEEVEFPAELGIDAAAATAGAQADGAAAPEAPSQPAVAQYVPNPIVDDRILGEFVSRQSSALEDMENLVLELENRPEESKTAELRRFIHTLKGESGLIGFVDMERVCHVTEDAIDQHPIEKLTDILLDVKDWLARVFAAHSGKGPPAETGDDLIGRLRALGTETEAAVEAPAPEPAAAPAPAAPQEQSPAPEPAPAPAAPAAPAPTEAELAVLTEPAALTGDPDLLSEFVTESQEHLENADVHLLTVETDPHDADALNAVFRAFHTIKGVAGFLDLPAVQKLAHEAENLLDRARKGELELSGGYMDLTFDAVDRMKRMVGRVAESLASGSPMPPEPGLPEFIAKLQEALSGKPLDAKPGSGAGRVGEILVDRGLVSDDDVTSALVKQQTSTHNPVGELLLTYAYISRSQLNEALKHQKEAGGEKRIGEILVEMGAVTEQDIEAALKKQQEGKPPPVGEVLVRDGKARAEDVAQALRGQKAAPQQQRVEVKEAVRVDSDRLDRLLDLVGELVICESMVSQADELQDNASTQLMGRLSQLDKITRELQEMGTSLRMVPVRATFQKMARLVRDLAKKANKKVEFEMAGEDTELDKSVVDRIGDPLVHMVRNAVDHGLEASPADRLAAGKNEAGHVTLRAFHRGGSIFIEIEDDGRGLDRDAILRKAVDKGLITDGDGMPDRDVWNLVFEPGFSTAKQITDVSGRGVGMDVVRRNIEALRGQVEIASEKGVGTKFSIKLPLTLAIIDGMVVRVGRERYIIPTLSVVRSVQPTTEELHSVVNKGEMLSLQGALLPMFRLEGLFGVHDALQEPTEALVVVVEDDGKQAGVMVDELLGQQQIVIKSLGDAMRGIPGISGGAIMSDGGVSLILDVGGLVRLAHSGTNGNAAAAVAAGGPTP